MSFSKPSPIVDRQSKAQSKRQKVKRHFKRCWPCHLFAWICIIVLVVCITIFVIVPVAAQNKIDAASLEIQGINVLECKPDSFLIQINSTITTDGSVKADLDAFEGNLTLVGVPDTEPFLSLQFPRTNANKVQSVNISQTVAITHKKAFEQYNQAFFRNETIKIQIYGRTKAQPAGLAKKYPVTFQKTAEVKGLNMLKGTEIKQTTISFERGLTRLNATAIINNRSYYALEMGNVTFNVFADGHQTGSLDVTNLFLSPGMNNVPITSLINQTEVLQLVQSPKYCKTGIIPFQIRGDKVEVDGQAIPWLQAAMGGSNQTVDINVGEIMGKKSGDFCA